MKLRKTKIVTIPFNNVELNLAESPYHLSPDQAVILQNMDFDDDRQSLVGRYGTTTLNPDGILLHGGTTGYYEFFDLFRTEDTSNGNKYVLGAYDNGVNVHLAYLRTNNTAQTKFVTLKQVASAEFYLTSGARLTFCNAKCPTNGEMVLGFNGVDKPFWINLTTAVVTPFDFGGAANDFRIKYVYERPWRGHVWAMFRTAEKNTIHWSATDDYTSFVTASSSGFLQCPANRPDNPVRSMMVINDRMIVFNLNSIGEVYYTGNADDPFKYRELKNYNGTFHMKSTQEADRGIMFLDKTPPYLKLFNGSQIETMDPTGSVEKGFQTWMNVSVAELLKTRMIMQNGNLLISFLAQPTQASTGTDGNRWLAVINTTRRNAQGVLYYPFNLWKIRSNDIIVGDEGTDFGQVWYSDPDAQTVDEESRYYVRRLLGPWDVRGGGVGFGDKRGTTATATDVEYKFRTGWMTLGTLLWKEYMLFKLHAEWEGTPSTGATLSVKYRCEGWTGWETLSIAAVALYKNPIPFPQTAQGKLIQFEFTYTDKQSRPLLNHIELEVRVKGGVA